MVGFAISPAGLFLFPQRLVECWKLLQEPVRGRCRGTGSDLVMELSSNPGVFIVILNWNGYRDSVTCLQSLREISYPSCEMVFVDNGSTDGSVARLKEEFKDVVYLENQENLGYTGGNNAGIRDAMEHGAEYVWILNNDTKVSADALTRLIAAAEKDRKAGLIGPKILQMENPELAYSMVGRLNMWFPWPDRMEGGEGSRGTGEAGRGDV